MEKIKASNNILSVNIKEKSFDKHKVIENLQIIVKDGDIVSIVGRSGVGKSTVLKIIAGIDVAYDGNVIFNDNEVTSPIKEISLLLQGHVLLPWLTVKQNIEFICSGVKEKVIKAYLKTVDIADKVDEWPSRLSGGEKTRVGLSAALINHSRLLLLDEPFSDIDIGVKKDILRLLSDIKIKNGMTIIMTTHNIEDALDISDKVCVFGGSPSNVVYMKSVDNAKKDVIRDEIGRLLIK